METFLWVEKYRPKTVDDCILPSELKKSFSEFVKDKHIPNLILSGSAGTGKTTIAKAMVEEIGSTWMLINGSEESGIDVLRTKIKNFASTVSLEGGRKYIILDEADYLNPQSTQPALRGFMVKLAESFFKRVQDILGQEQIKFEPKAIAELINKYFPDWRRCLNELQRYSTSGQIDAGILVNLSSENIKELVSFMKAKEFTNVRKWIVNNLDNDPSRIFRTIYNSLYDNLDHSTIPHAVVIIADYQYKSAFVADQEINMVACLTEIMAGCKFK